jgi:acyl-coenzyme A thioesterase PaaI-like protein
VPHDVPDGFAREPRSSPYLDLIGPLWRRDGADGPVFAVCVEAHHANRAGVAGGGLLVSIVDIAMSRFLREMTGETGHFRTVSLATDFAGAARVGDWVEVWPRLVANRGRLLFCEARMTVDGAPVVRASAVFSRVPGD